MSMATLKGGNAFDFENLAMLKICVRLFNIR